MSIGTNMFGIDADQTRTGDDRNHTVLVDTERDAGTRNFTDELYLLPDYINVTLLDTNSTEEIDSFYFYEVSLQLAFARFVLVSRNATRVSRDTQCLVQLRFSDF